MAEVDEDREVGGGFNFIICFCDNLDLIIIQLNESQSLCSASKLYSNKPETCRRVFQYTSPGDISKQFYDGVQYRAVKGLFASYALNRFSQYGKLNSLYKFYPYQKIVKETKEELCEDWTSNIQLAAIVTGASWTFLYQYAKRGQVLSILREYGSVLKTHRLFRQYLYTLVLPFAIANEYTFVHYHDHIEQLWQVHANRLNKKDLSDPTGTQYPEELRAPRRDVFINKWH